MFDLQDEQMRQWIREHLDDDEADENTPGWDELAEEWSYLHSEYEDQGEYLDWYERHAHSEIQQTFHSQIGKLKDLLRISVAEYNEDTFFKMAYAHAVTLMESFLADTVKSLVITNDIYLFNSLSGVDSIKDCRYSLSDIARQKDGVKGFVLIELTKLMYHNIPKIKAVLNGILGRDINVDMTEVCRITNLRHDIVHRDGRKISGDAIQISREMVQEAIENIEGFVDDISEQIYSPAST